jgi:hypothetical protein
MRPLGAESFKSARGVANTRLPAAPAVTVGAVDADVCSRLELEQDELSLLAADRTTVGDSLHTTVLVHQD